MLMMSVCVTTLMAAPVSAEDCTGTLPAGDCTLDENTTGALTIDNTVTLTVGGSVTIGHTVDGSANNVGTITTNSGGVAVNQTAAIGGAAAIDSLSIGNNDSWTTSADIITDGSNGDANNGAVAADIDLGTADGGETLTINGGVTIDGFIDGHAADNVNVGGNGSGGTFSFDKQINTVILNIVSGTMTADSSIGSGTALADLNISSGARLNLNGASNTTTTLDLDGTVSIGSGKLLTVQAYNADANNGELILGLDRDTGVTSNGVLSFTGGGPADLSNMTFVVNIEQGSEVLVSETVTNVIQGNGGATTLPTISDTSFLYDFSLVQSGVSNVDLVISRNELTQAATTGNNLEAAGVLLSQLEVSTSANVQAAQANLANASSQEQFNEILESTVPAMDHGTTVAANLITNKTISLAQQRLAYLRSGRGANEPSGIATGNAYSARGESGGRIWGQVFGASGEQSKRNGIDGYDTTATGVSFGADTGGIHDKLVVGALLTYAKTKVESDNATATESDINSYQIAGYGTYEFDNDMFLNGTLTFGLNQIDSYRYNVGGTGNHANAQYDSEQIGLQFELGKDYRDDEVVVTPSFFGRYTYLEAENYRERGVAGLNLTVNEDSVHALEIGPRVNMRWEYITDTGMFVIPEINLGYSYDLIGDTAKSAVSYEAGGPQIALEGFEAQKHKFNFGFGGLLADDEWELKANYDFDVNGDFAMHSGYVRGAYKF